MNPVVKGALQGAIPTLVLVGGTNLIVKKFRESKPVFYWGSLAVATGVAIAVVQRGIPTPVNHWDNMTHDDFQTMYQFYKEVPDGWEEDEPGLTFKEFKQRVMEKRDPINVPIAMKEAHGVESEVLSADSNIDNRSANLRELRKLLEEELSRLAQDNYKIEKQLKGLERGIPKEYPIENIRYLLDSMHESLGNLNRYGMNYLNLLQ